jgi:hypothetical protein
MAARASAVLERTDFSAAFSHAVDVAACSRPTYKEISQ